jgi:CSLREA domain-containing protein
VRTTKSAFYNFTDFKSKVRVVKKKRKHNMPKTENHGFYGLITIIFIFLCCGISINAATFNVTKITDTNDGVCNADCSLREAIAAANAAATDDVIEFSSAVFGTVQTITLGGTQLEINNNGSLTINGTGAANLIVSGNNASRVFVFEGTTAVLNNIKVTGGKILANGDGGGIFNNSGNVTINNSVITNNAAASGTFSGEGGGIYNRGTMIINSSTISNNSAASQGGGISSTSGTGGGTAILTVNNSTISGNTTGGIGAGLYNYYDCTINVTGSVITGNQAVWGGGVSSDGTATLTNTSVSNNGATQGGGGIAVGGRAFMTLSGVTIDGNIAAAAGGGIWSNGDFGGSLTITGSTIKNNRSHTTGGALFNTRKPVDLSNSLIENNEAFDSGGGINDNNIGTPFNVTNTVIKNNRASKNGGGIAHTSGTLTLTNSTVQNNFATALTGSDGGGGIFNSGFGMTIVNSTVIGNSTNNLGGGIYSRGSLSLTSATIVRNQAVNGGGAFNLSNSTLNARNTIFADNTSENGINPDFSGTLKSQGYNLLENLSGTTVSGILNGNILGKDPQLLVLRDNGGATQTSGLLPTSPAIDTGDPNNFPATDQRGVARAQDGDLSGTALPDIGAYERQVFSFMVTKIADTNDGACDADCSLREATAAAQTLPVPDKAVVFDPSLFSAPQTITLALGEYQINNPNGTLAVYGTGSELLTISANNQSRVIFNSDASIAAILNLTVADGNVKIGLAGGGGILNNGLLSIENLVLRNNTANYSGGGIYNNGIGSLYVNSSIIRNNHAGAEGGGGISNFMGGSVSVTGTTISANGTTGNGGGIFNSGGAFSVISSTVSGNSAVQRGGGIHHSGMFGAFRVMYSTVAANTAQISGGGAFSAGSQIEAFSTIFGDNSSVDTGSAPDFGGRLFSVGYNLIENPTGTTNEGVPTGYLTGVDPQLLPLGDYGGSMPTHALRPNSPAIDKGLSLGATFDQRGKPRPFDNPLVPNAAGGNGTDIGAFERQKADILQRTPYDFDGDGKTDIGIFRPSDGSWWYTRSSDDAFRVYAFGAAGDLLTPGDYTGDGKSDIAVFRPATGEWFVQRSEDNSFFSFPFGVNGDIPAPTDYDGDGKTDAAVFRPSSGTWFILNSGGSGTSIVQFGSAEDKPVAADYDGDGKADVAIFRPSDGSWWYLRSSDSQFRVFSFGVSTDKPVQGDYTGDGKADLAVFGSSSGEWFVQRSEDNSYFSVPFGAMGDIAVPGDYDGDGKFDTAVFRPSTADWFVQRSTAGIIITHFGTTGDRPIPNAFVP